MLMILHNTQFIQYIDIKSVLIAQHEMRFETHFILVMIKTCT